MARLFIISLLLFTTNRGNDGGLSTRLPVAQAFTPQALRKKKTFSKNSHEITTPHRSSPTRRQHPIPGDTTNLLRMEGSSSENTVRLSLPLIALVSLSLTTVAALTEHLPGPPIDATAPPPSFATLAYGVFFSGSCDPYLPSLIFRDSFSTAIAIVGASAFVKGVTYPAKMGYIEPRDARKIIHTFSVPLFVLCWPLFSNAYGARVFATIVPLLNVLRLYLAGTGSGSDSGAEANSFKGSESELAGAISRSGDAKEALGGPFIYVLVMVFATLLFWTDSPIGIVAMATMACGDGLADLIGRRFGSSNKWFFNKSKSVAGSAAFVVGSFVGSYGLISWLISMGAMDPLELGIAGLVGRLFTIAVICAGVELIPDVDDNWTVPSTAALLSAFLLN